MSKLSIIIPVLDEESFLVSQQKIFSALIKQGHEIIVVDGGSSDETVGLANQIGCKIFTTRSSRGHQLHFGVEHSNNDLLLFLHADTILPENAAALICAALSPANKHWGRFDVLFSNSKLIFHIIAWCMNKRSRVTGIVTGDQAIFAKRTSYFSCGGFPDYSIMEDIEMSKRFKKLGSPVCLSSKVISSSRKWERQGVMRTIIKMWRLRLLFFFGMSTNKLAKLY